MVIKFLKPLWNGLLPDELGLSDKIGLGRITYDWIMKSFEMTEVHFTTFLYELDRSKCYRVISEPRYDASDDFMPHVHYFTLLFDWRWFFQDV